MASRQIFLQIVLIMVQVAIYYPFFKVLDKQACEEEGIAIE